MKQIWKTKSFKHLMSGAAGMSKKSKQLGREPCLEVKMLKSQPVRTLFEIEMLKRRTPLWRAAHFEAKMRKTSVSDHFLEVAMSKN